MRRLRRPRWMIIAHRRGAFLRALRRSERAYSPPAMLGRPPQKAVRRLAESDAVRPARNKASLDRARAA